MFAHDAMLLVRNLAAGFSIEGHLKSEVVLDNTRTAVVRLGLVNPAASVVASWP